MDGVVQFCEDEHQGHAQSEGSVILNLEIRLYESTDIEYNKTICARQCKHIADRGRNFGHWISQIIAYKRAC